MSTDKLNKILDAKEDFMLAKRKVDILKQGSVRIVGMGGVSEMITEEWASVLLNVAELELKVYQIYFEDLLK